MINGRLQLAASVAAGVLSGTFGIAAIAAEPAFVSPLGITLETPGTMQASQAYATLRRANSTQQSGGMTGSTANRQQAADAVMNALATYERLLPVAKRDAAALIDALKKANRLAVLDKDFYARPAAYVSNSGEVAAVRAAGGPVAVLSNAASIYDRDLAELKSQLGQGRSAWRFDISPIPNAHAGTACSLAAWVGKMTCIGYKPCYYWWAKANNDNCL